MPSPQEEYQRRLDSGELSPDPAQRAMLVALERLYHELVDAEPVASGWRRLLTRFTGGSQAAPQGVYLWGHVGRGKTLAMDLFYGCLPFENKERRHFHRFMADIHEELKQLRQQPDPLDQVAEDLAGRVRVICFDEFAVTDIADAMILSKLFAGLFARGVTLVATSNIKPRGLYKGGLQRVRFLPAIRLIEKHTEVVQVGGAHDYRLESLENAEVYLLSDNPSTAPRLDELFRKTTDGREPSDEPIRILNRSIACLCRADGVIWFSFEQLCDGPRSQNDYIELSRHYHTVFLSGVPQFNRALENQARRFIAVVDEFYDRRVNLILSAQVPLATLYAGQKLSGHFERTRSRLHEMRGREYLTAHHKA